MDEELRFSDLISLIMHGGEGKISFSMSDIAQLFMYSGKAKLAMLQFHDCLQALVEISKGKPVPFSEAQYKDPTDEDDSDDDDQDEFWYDDKKLRSCDLQDELRRYPIVADVQLDELHHDIISYWDADWNVSDPMFGLKINLVFEDSEDAKENGQNWYIEVTADDDEDRQFLLIIEDGRYYFA